MAYSPKRIEIKWQKRWAKTGIYEPNLKHPRRPFYNLTMFPYPSAEGLHVGNMYDMVGCDIFGRFKRMQGYDVFQPIGLDGFGIHSENYALKINKHPMAFSKVTEKRFYEQIPKIGAGFAWKEHLETYDPEYYKWTQWIFVQMFKRGLAYRKKAPVNWCPSCLTVLADEQVIAGECERCGMAVMKKELEQWFFKITAYAERLLKNLEKIDWSENIKTAQRNWIGKSEGAELEFRIQNSEFRIKIFTTRPDTVFGATFMAIAPDHQLVSSLITKERKEGAENYLREIRRKNEAERPDAGKAKTGVFTGSFAINPANNEAIPVWIADYVLSSIGTGAIMAVPAHDERDFEFAKKFNLPIKIVICPHYPKTTCPILQKAYEGEGHLVGSGRFDGMASEPTRGEIARWLGGKVKTQYRLRDWLISRQRYWGPPIPIIYCRRCWETLNSKPETLKNLRYGVDYATFDSKEFIIHPVPEKDLPVKLPYIKSFRPTGSMYAGPLASSEAFYKTRCPKCGSEAYRETDVSDTFLDSAWYYYRYIDTQNKKEIFGRERMKKWLPAARYMGGLEHAVLHLLYTRFITMIFYDWGLIPFDEPFKTFRAHGHITKDGVKMSKSKGNVVNPDEYIRVYGADALRMYLMFLGPFELGGDFRDTGIRGITRFLERVWRFVSDRDRRQTRSELSESRPNYPNKMGKHSGHSGAFVDLGRVVHRTVKKVTEDIENLQYNTAISALMILLNEFEASPEGITQKDQEIFLKLLAPFAPHLTEELWRHLGNKRSIHIAEWPKHDKRYLEEKIFPLIVQVNGKLRATIEARVGVTEEAARKIALDNEAVKKYVSGVPKKVIFVKDKLINFVV